MTPYTFQRLSLAHGVISCVELSAKVFQYESRTRAVTKLELTEFGDSPSAFRKLLLWPKELHHFSFCDCDASQNSFSLMDFELFLTPHKETLQSICLESLFSRQQGCIDFSDFPKLKSITISVYDLKCTPQEAASKLLAPQLESFTWSWLMLTQHCESIRDFNEERAKWLSDFLTIATHRKSALRKVYIRFRPEDYYPSEDELAQGSFPYPWDLMDEIAVKFESYGIQLTYDKPSMNKDEMVQLAQEINAEREAGSESWSTL